MRASVNIRSMTHRPVPEFNYFKTGVEHHHEIECSFATTPVTCAGTTNVVPGGPANASWDVRNWAQAIAPA